MGTEMRHDSFTDLPAEVDFLRCDEYFRGLARFIRGCETPMTIAIQGGWGTGKTSAMKIIQRQLEEDQEAGSDLITVEFNTWQYAKSSEENLILPLLIRLNETLDRYGEEKDSYKQLFSEKTSPVKAGMAAGIRIARLFGAVAGAKDVIDEFGDLFGQMKEAGKDGFSDDALSAYYSFITDARATLQEKIDVLVGAKTIEGKQIVCQEGGQTGRVVVFVDDLDRLSPECAVALLEDMKNLMDCRHCVFVLALDHAIVQRGLKQKYGEIEPAYAEHYFDKIIQVPFNLPVNRYDIGEYFRRLGEGDECLAEVAQALMVRNPRTIKRALNLLRLYESIEESRGEGRDMDRQNGTLRKQQRFLILLMQMLHPGIYRELTELLDRADPLEPMQKLEEFFEPCQDDRKTAMVQEALVRFFGRTPSGSKPSGFIDLPALYDLVRKSAVTDQSGGEEAEEMAARAEADTREMVERLRDYMTAAGFQRDMELPEDELKFQAGEVEIQLKTTGANAGTHANINIIQTGLFSKDGCGPEELKKRNEELRGRLIQAYPEFEDWLSSLPIKNGPGGSDSDFFFIANNDTLVLRAVQKDDLNAMLFTGAVLRALADGRFLSPAR